MEPDGQGGLALRLGFRQIKGLREEDAGWLTAARGNGYHPVARCLAPRGAGPAMMERLAEADVFAGLGLTRREALWEAKALVAGPGAAAVCAAIMDGEAIEEPAACLPQMTLGEEVVEDYVRHAPDAAGASAGAAAACLDACYQGAPEENSASGGGILGHLERPVGKEVHPRRSSG